MVLAVSGCASAAATSAATTPSPRPTVTQSGPPGGDRVGPQGQLYSEAAAVARAAKDVALVHLPVGATLQHTPVPRALLHFTESIGGLTGVVTQWWTVPGTTAAVQDYVLHHPPTGLLGGVDTGNLHGETGLDYHFPGNAKQPQTLVGVSTVQVNSHVDVRVQAFVVWTPTRTAIERIPSSVTSATLVYRPALAKFKKRTVVVTGAHLRPITHLLNRLQASSDPGHSCPGGAVDSVTITMSFGTHRLTFAAIDGGCGFGVDVTADGVPQPALERPDLLMDAVHQALHVPENEYYG
ncbi:hypothetical protein acdb102_27720 [Acidothermaceae bacterium B102]|nr:hypothetical protein acdb102_27720 [Acidothermaceae bacterium B102]